MDLKENITEEQNETEQLKKEEIQPTIEKIKKETSKTKIGLLVLLVIASMISGYFIIGKVNQLIVARKTNNVAVNDPTKTEPNQNPPDIPNLPPDPNIPKDPVPTGKIILKVGSETITDIELAEEVKKLKPPDFEQRMMGVPEKDRQVYRDRMNETAAKNLVNQIYFRLYLKEQKITVTAKDLKKTEDDLTEMMRKVHEQQKPGTPFSVEARLKEYGISMDTFRKDVENQTIYRLATSPILEKITATETEAKEFFAAHPELYNLPAKADLKSILLTSEADADIVIKELQAGADFASLAKAKSKDPQAKENGGSLGFIENDKTRVPVEILNVIFNPNTRINTPLKIKLETQWYVMIVSSFQAEVIKTYGELSDKAMYDVKESKREKALSEFLKVLEGKYGKPERQK